ncbi:MAG TPA: ABC transporter substrate-binding protein [Methylomirabilota bacterium]|nr:ABC transporter substrate-binding protein [Methylomirabilota bacterium]
MPNRNRRGLCALAALVAVALLVTGPAGQPRRGGILTWATHQDVDQTDVHKSFALLTGMVLGRNVFDRLVEHNEKLELVPRLAERWETSGDGRTWTFHLRKGVKFHDGTPFNAEAVKFNIDRALNPENRLLAGRFAYAGVQAAEVVSEHAVRLVTKEPVGALLDNMADSGFGAIQSPKSIKEAPVSGIVPTGTGPFKLASWTRGDQLVLEANPDYWDGRPNLDRVVVRPVPEGGTRASLLETGEAQLIAQVPLQDVKRLQGNRSLAVDVPAATSWQYIALDTQKLADVRVRQALNHAVDKRQIVQTNLFGVGRVADSPIGSGYRMYASVGSYDYSPERAKQLLAEAGWRPGAGGILEKDGQRLSLTLLIPTAGHSGWPEMAQAVQAYLKAVGVEVKLSAQEWATYLATARKPAAERGFDMALLSWGTADPDSGMRIVLHSAMAPPAGSNVALYRNPRVDDLLARGAATIGFDKRAPLYREAQQLVWQDAPWIFLAERREAVGRRVTLEGVTAIPSSAGLVDVRRAWIK